MSNIRMFVRHVVNDYATWRNAYDDFDTERQTMGVTGHGEYRTIDNENEITVWHDFARGETASSFASSERLKTVMQAAGVQGVPEIWFTTKAES